MHRIVACTVAIVMPVVKNWLEQDIAQWVHYVGFMAGKVIAHLYWQEESLPTIAEPASSSMQASKTDQDQGQL